jgi:two-component system, sensor histidine kinase
MTITHPFDSHWNRFNLLTQRGNLSTQETLKLMLNIGLDALSMDMGIVSRIVGQDYTIEFCSNRHYLGTHFALTQTYCEWTVQHGAVVDIANIGQIFSQHPHENALHVESYIGIPLVLQGHVYGTLCFVRAKPRPQLFTPDDLHFIYKLAQKVSNTLNEAVQSAR